MDAACSWALKDGESSTEKLFHNKDILTHILWWYPTQDYLTLHDILC